MPAPFLELPDLPLDRMEPLARSFAVLLATGDTVTLSGEVGAGKTSFARALIQTIAPEMPGVTSPTFTLMQSYDVLLPEGKPEILWHLDLYRLEHAEEAEALGLEELWPHIVLMEWPQIASAFLPEGYLDIAFRFGASAESRTLIFTGNDAWRQRLAGLV